MPRMTLLNMTQNILSSLDSDNVNSISDTVESDQVAEVIEETYYEILSRKDWRFMRQATELESAADTNDPTKIRIPDNVTQIHSLKYQINKSGEREKWKDICYLEPEVFLNRVQGNDSTASNVKFVTTQTGISFYPRNDTMPSFWTSFDEEFIYFDSYDSTQDSTVQESKTTITATVEPTWQKSDTFVPKLPTRMFTLLLEQSKATCHIILKQQQNPTAERIAYRQYVKMREFEDVTNIERRGTHYGR